MLQRDGAVLIAGSTPPGPRQAPLREHAELLALEGDGGRPSPLALLEVLALRGINDVLVEAGPTLAGAFVQHGLADELILYAAPTLLGSDARPLLELPGITRMSQQLRLEIIDLARVGRDLRLRLRPETGAAAANHR
jgi:diaminohydroxyphosphoribosylaminopyrimidine deaminase/5-amino-6-(5-phosphoribosylamino)uracil reductase